MNISVIDYNHLEEQIVRKENELRLLKEKFHTLPQLQLSSVYKDEMAYAVCYEDGHGSLEALNTLHTIPGYAVSYAQDRTTEFLHGRLWIVSMKPESIVRMVEKK